MSRHRRLRAARAGPSRVPAGWAAAAARPTLRGMSPLAKGFTLIEQATVIATVGVLAATALPKLTALNTEVEASALAIVAGSAGTAMVINRGSCSLDNAPQRPDICLPVRDCRDAEALLAAPLPGGFVISARALPTGATRHLGGDCELLHTPSGRSASFRGYAVGG